MDVFDFVNSINNTKKNLYTEDQNVDKIYVPFIVNKALSYFLDTVLHANFMNGMPHISKKMQYEYYLHSIRKGKRYSKWHKFDSDLEELEFIKQLYECSDKKAKDYLNILTKEQLAQLRHQFNIGGNMKLDK
jgi:hypothetical protein